MTYSHRNLATERIEACQKAKQITAICEELSISVDPIDWQDSGMRAWVSVNTVKIGDLKDLRLLDSASILRRVQIKLLEQAALASIHTRPDLKVLMWSPVDVIQPQEFLSLWVITMETDERVTIAEYIRNGQRVYEPYPFDVNNGEQLAKLFGPIHTGEYQPGDTVIIEEHQRKCSGEIVYVLPPGKTSMNNRKSPSKGYHTIAGKAYTNDASARYMVDCHDGFPHMVNQSQITTEASDTVPLVTS
ncbi:MAG: hypothetical protein JO031_09590 [Ktedonobacteraceae bacterium]|nr:hypothetical protein [Ktedonobacteraceae bacterium]